VANISLEPERPEVLHVARNLLLFLLQIHSFCRCGVFKKRAQNSWCTARTVLLLFIVLPVHNRASSCRVSPQYHQLPKFLQTTTRFFRNIPWDKFPVCCWTLLLENID
jgi:hypothetical protein